MEPKSLDEAACRSYVERGFLSPLPGVSAGRAGELLGKLNAVRTGDVKAVVHPWYYKAYLLFTWLDELVRTPALLVPVKSLLGEDVLCLSCDIWRKSAGETRHISWHQDASYWHFDPPAIVTAWLALTNADAGNGAMRFLPASHHLGPKTHVDTFAADNMLSHGQTVQIPTDGRETVTVSLRPGEFSLHHCLLAHASGPNPSDTDRVGLCIRYAPGSLRQTEGPRVSAMTVCGVNGGNLIEEQAPTESLSTEAIAQHTRLLAPHAAVRYTSF